MRTPDSMQEKKRTPFKYLQMEYAQYVLHNVSFAEVPYSVSDYERKFESFSYDNPAVYYLAHCKSFSSNARLRNEAECRAYLEQLWHGMGQIGHTGDVPRKIVHYPACNTVGFSFGEYMLHYENGTKVWDGGMTVYVDDRTGELIGWEW